MPAWVVLVLGLACVFTLLGQAHATTSGLILIPTADTVGADRYQLQLSTYSGTSTSPSLSLAGVEAGIGNRCEAGFDLDLDLKAGPHLLGNFKYAFRPDASAPTRIAIGVDNWEDRLTSGPYMLATRSTGRVRLTGGYTNIYGVNRLLAGVDTGFDHGVTYMADYVSGPDLYYSAGVSWQLGTTLQLQLGTSFPNGGGAPYIFALFAVNCHMGSSR